MKRRFFDEAVQGLMVRSGLGAGHMQPTGREFEGMRLIELAKHRLTLAGESIRGGPDEVFGRAMASSDFSNILADVAHKAMLEGFSEATETYDAWADTTGRVEDFKPHVFARASEAPSLVEVNPDGGEYTYGAMTDAKETVTVVDYGIIVPFTRKAMVNDDLGALSDIRQKLGVASKAKYGDLVYAVITGNPVMGDGYSLFHDEHGNAVASGGGAPSVPNLNIGAAKMATQKDLQGQQLLNIRPQFILAPWALKGTVDNLVVQTTPVAPGSGASPVVNPWNYLTPVYDARLDANGVKKWYLAAQKGKTVKLFTMAGNKVPHLEARVNWNTDSLEIKCRITAAAMAVDYRGLFYNAGE